MRLSAPIRSIGPCHSFIVRGDSLKNKHVTSFMLATVFIGLFKVLCRTQHLVHLVRVSILGPGKVPSFTHHPEAREAKSISKKTKTNCAHLARHKSSLRVENGQSRHTVNARAQTMLGFKTRVSKVIFIGFIFKGGNGTSVFFTRRKVIVFPGPSINHDNLVVREPCASRLSIRKKTV
ncbi:hypothetical protein NDU88_003370 [Pleurodeles waltl]|uniref:Uncharacterized protein n=1 Tax=Pleurodeles waltl TaxID=8319 RepID=A0AAV7L5V1_PLEWA|nr:hypothetical protein NDU88_003370 [Pleurodeles waltl]